MTDLIDLAGKTVIVTGASSGIGAATARRLHAAGPTRCWPPGGPAGWTS
jgi:NADP-dependent 3-hydroxy acid dehydrogenase YdfG